jgi:predicted alpha/beta superfamily hydrolase
MWSAYTPHQTKHTVVGELLVQTIYSPQLLNEREIYVWLPADYHTNPRHYPVVYMHDGQNLFDRYLSFVGEWQVDETLTTLASEGYAAIVVGIPNTPARRWEYNPYPSRFGIEFDGRGAAYLRYIVETIKPSIDRDFRTLSTPVHTGIMGSSMGGLISLYAFVRYPQVFGFCGALSPAYWFGDLAQTLRDHADGQGKVYLDVGTEEGYIFPGLPPEFQPLGDATNAGYVAGVQALKKALLARGYQDGATLLYVEEPHGKHHEEAWARRLPQAFRFLLPR